MRKSLSFTFTLRLAEKINSQVLSDFLEKARFIDTLHTSRMLISLVTDPKLIYHVALDNFDLIKQNDTYILYSHHVPITKEVALEIMYAMLNNKPIIMLHPPVFSKDIDLFSREAITKRINKIMICDLQVLSEDDLHTFLHNTAQDRVNYVVTKRETVQIKSRLKAYFRNLTEN